MGTPDPRAAIRNDWPGVRVFARWMPEEYALTTWTDNGATIELAVDLGPEQQTYTLSHELGHLVAGVPCRSFCPQNEREVVAWTARYLIPDVAELGALLATRDIADAAAELGLPPDAVYDRLAHMTPAETETISTHLRAVSGGTGRIAASPRRGPSPVHHCKRRT